MEEEDMPSMLDLLRRKLDAGQITAEEYCHLRDVHKESAEELRRDVYEFSASDLSGLNEVDRVLVMDKVKSGAMDVHTAIESIKKQGGAHMTPSQQRLMESGTKLAPVLRETQSASFKVPPPPPPKDGDVQFRRTKSTNEVRDKPIYIDTRTPIPGRPDLYDNGSDSEEYDIVESYDNVVGSGSVTRPPTLMSSMSPDNAVNDSSPEPPPIAPIDYNDPKASETPVRMEVAQSYSSSAAQSSPTQLSPTQSSSVTNSVEKMNGSGRRGKPNQGKKKKRSLPTIPPQGRQKPVITAGAPTKPGRGVPHLKSSIEADVTKDERSNNVAGHAVTSLDKASRSLIKSIESPQMPSKKANTPTLSKMESGTSTDQSISGPKSNKATLSGIPQQESTTDTSAFGLKTPTRDPPSPPKKTTAQTMSGAAINKAIREKEGTVLQNKTRHSVMDISGQVHGLSLNLALQSRKSPVDNTVKSELASSDEELDDLVGSLVTPKVSSLQRTRGPLKKGDTAGKTRYSIKQRQKRQAAVLERMGVYADDISDWLTKLLELSPPVTTDTLLGSLEDGIILGKVAKEVHKSFENWRYPTKLKPELVKPPKFTRMASVGSFQARDNVANFIRWVTELGCPCLFETEDLVLHKNDMAVLYCLMDVARGGAKCLSVLPQLIIFEQEIDEDVEASEATVSAAVTHNAVEVKDVGEMMRKAVEEREMAEAKRRKQERLEQEALEREVAAAREAAEAESARVVAEEEARRVAAEVEKKAEEELIALRARMVAAEAEARELARQEEEKAAEAARQAEVERQSAEKAAAEAAAEAARLEAEAAARVAAEETARVNAERLERQARERLLAMERELEEAKQAAEREAKEVAEREAAERAARAAEEERRRLAYEAEVEAARQAAAAEAVRQREALEREMAAAKAEEQEKLRLEAIRLEELRKEQEEVAAERDRKMKEEMKATEEAALKAEEERQRLIALDEARMKAAWEEMMKAKEIEERRLAEEAERIQAVRKQQEAEAAEAAARALEKKRAQETAAKQAREAAARRQARLEAARAAATKRQREEEEKRAMEEVKMREMQKQLEEAKARKREAQKKAREDEERRLKLEAAAAEAETRAREAEAARIQAEAQAAAKAKEEDNFWLQEALRMEQESAKKRKAKASTVLKSPIKAGQGTVIPKEMAEKLVDLGLKPKGHGRYMLNKQQLHIRLYKQHLVVRVGGGWDTLENYLLNHYKTREGLKGHVLIKDSSGIPKWEKAPELDEYTNALEESKEAVAEEVAKGLREGTQSKEEIKAKVKSKMTAEIEFQQSKTLNKIGGFAKRPSRSPAKKITR